MSANTSPVMKHFLGFIICVLLVTCTQKTGKEQIKAEIKTPDSVSMHLIADTIIYDVVIRNTNPYDTWIEQSLEKLQHGKLIDSLFALVYERKTMAYDYFSNEELSVKQIEILEKEEGFARDRIGKIQFTEAWYFNKKTKTLHKEVISVALGHELYSDSGEFRGYKPVFKLYLNP